MHLFLVSFRTIFFYIAISLAYRIMGKREIGQLGIVDLIVSILIAELAAISIENYTESLIYTLLPIFLLVMIEITLAFLTMKFRSLRIVLEGKPALLICSGKINYHELLKQRYNLDDLLINLRQNHIKSIDEVEYAFLEKNGKLSIFPYVNNKNIFPMPIIIDGKIEKAYLNKIKITEKEIHEYLKNSKLNINNIFYGFYKDKKIFIIKKNDLNSTYINKK